MRPPEVRELYDDAYAEAYDERFLQPTWGREASEFELEIIRERLGSDGSYLDVACGTGWFLSQFPGRTRAGLDLSAAMLERARRRNPDAELRQGDFRRDQDDWHGRWDVVTCMWFAYCYAETVPEVESLLSNMARWTSPRGAVLLPVCDTAALGLEPVPYKSGVVEFSGEMRITSLTWTWVDSHSGRTHHNLVAPHVDHLADCLGAHFHEVALVHYPPVVLGQAPDSWTWERKALLATRKREPGDTTPAVRRDVRPPGEEPARPDAEGASADERRSVYRRVRSRARGIILRGLQAAERRLGK